MHVSLRRRSSLSYSVSDVSKQEKTQLSGPFSTTRVYPITPPGDNEECTASTEKHSSVSSQLSGGAAILPRQQPNDTSFNSVMKMESSSSSSDEDTGKTHAPVGDAPRVATPSQVEAHTDVNIAMPNNAADVDRSLPHDHCHLSNGLADFSKSNAPIRRIEHPVDRSLFLAFLLSIIFLILTLIFLGPSLVLVCVILPLGWMVRRLVVCCCCCCSPRRACALCSLQMLSNHDLFWLHDSKFNKMVSQSLFVLESGLDITRIRDLVHARVISAEAHSGSRLYPRFTQIIVPLLSGYAWKSEDHFHIENHILPMPTYIKRSEHLQQYVSDMAATPLSFDKPLWEMLVLGDYGSEKDTVILLRVHPCVSDGITLMRVLTRSLVDYTPHNEITNSRFGHSTYLFNAFRAIFIGPLVFFQKWIFTRGDCNILRGPLLSGQKTIAWSDPFCLSDVIRIKQITRSTLNDVFLSVVAGNLRKCLQSQGISNPYDMLAMLPIDLHSDSPNIKMGVKFILSDISVPTNTEGTIPRLWEIKHRMDEVKNSADPVIMHVAISVLANILPITVWQAIWSSIIDKCSVFISNLQGPGTTMSFASREIKRAMYWMPTRDNVALSVSILTYGDHVQMTVMADKAVVPNPNVLTTDFIAELSKLKVLLANRRIPGEHALRRMELLQDDGGCQSESTIEEIQCKMAEVQEQLQELKYKMNGEESEEFSATEQALSFRVQQLKEEFRQLLSEMRRKKSVDGAILCDEDEDDDGELRRSYRRRTYSGSSRRSVVSISAASVIATASRPLHTSVTHSTMHNASSSSVHHSSPSTPSHVDCPSVHTDHETQPSSCSSDIPLVPSSECRSVTDSSAVDTTPSSTSRDHVHIQNSYSPEVERKVHVVS